MSRPLRTICLLLLAVLPFRLTAQEELARTLHEQEEVLAHDPDNTEALRRLMFLHLDRADYRKAIEYGQRLLDIGYERKDYHQTVLYAHTGLGQAYTMLGDSIAYGHLGQARSNALTAQNDSALCSVYNGLGLYALNIDKDYYSALHYYFLGLEAAKRCHYERLHTILLANISAVYFLKRDTAGLAYSLEAYERGHRLSSPYLIYIGALTTAYMYYLNGEYDRALPYIKEAEFLMQQNDFYDQGNVHALYGMILTAQGNTAEAITLFRRGLALKEKNQTSTHVMLLHGYAQALQQEGQTDKAIRLLEEALSLTDRENNAVYRDEVIDALSDCYAAQGDYARALDWLRRLNNENDTLYNTDKEKIISELRLKYDSERQENEIKQGKLALLRKEKHEQLLIAILTVIGVATVLLWQLYRRKNRLYQSIVRQNQEALRREQQLSNHIRVLQNEKYTASSLTGEKKLTLFQRLEELMREQAIYKDNQLTKDKAAELLDTNRTYLSQAINEQTGLNFTQYINQYRVNEAVRLLSDPSNTTTLKAIAAEVGFSSMSTFYKLFQNSVGMPPKQYRDTVMELKEKDN